jgi:hypothetical protein
MKEEEWKEYIKLEKEKYTNLGESDCPMFPNEKIYFTKDGLNHLIRKGKDVRPRYEQMERFALLPYAKIILKNAKEINNFFASNLKDPHASFWSFKDKVNSIEIRVIIRQVGKGKKHFFSIMKEYQ